MADTYAQPRKAKNSDNLFEKHGKKIEKYGDTAINTLTGMALGAGAYGANLALTARSKAEKAAKARFDKYVADLDKKRVKKSLKKKGIKPSGGGAYVNLTKPLTTPRNRSIKRKPFDV